MQQWPPVISSILDEYSGRPLPLTRSNDCNIELARALRKSSTPAALFPNARNAQAAYSALLLLLGYWEESHDLIDEDQTPEGCYLHAIVHRVEPNPANSAYWLRQVGQHPLFPEVRLNAQEILKKDPVPGWQLKPDWDPYLFNSWCEEARRSPKSEKEKVASKIQRAEWDLLFPWCASPRNSG
ncbi:MAG TPA: hypothetical protein VFA65_02205 [Bryobacteraceae bacterium]|nr:hypothetical protein [Bryobacteraceae bacterium]